MTAQKSLVNRQKWRVCQYLSLYLGEPSSGEKLALELCELDSEQGKLKPAPGNLLDFEVPHPLLLSIGKGRLQSLQRLQLQLLERRAVTAALDTMSTEGSAPYENVRSSLIHYTDWHSKALPHLSDAEVSTWDFKIAMLNAVYQPEPQFNDGYSYSRNGYKSTVVSFRNKRRFDGPQWGGLFSCFLRRYEGRSSSSVATMILTNWYKNGVCI